MKPLAGFLGCSTCSLPSGNTEDNLKIKPVKHQELLSCAVPRKPRASSGAVSSTPGCVPSSKPSALPSVVLTPSLRFSNIQYPGPPAKAPHSALYPNFHLLFPPLTPQLDTWVEHYSVSIRFLKIALDTFPPSCFLTVLKLYVNHQGFINKPSADRSGLQSHQAMIGLKGDWGKASSVLCTTCFAWWWSHAALHVCACAHSKLCVTFVWVCMHTSICVCLCLYFYKCSSQVALVSDLNVSRLIL